MKKGVPVVLQVATSGIKVFDENEQASVYSMTVVVFRAHLFYIARVPIVITRVQIFHTVL